jgi:hypothetical protein
VCRALLAVLRAMTGPAGDPRDVWVPCYAALGEAEWSRLKGRPDPQLWQRAAEIWELARGAVCGRVRSLPTGRGAARDPSTSGPDPSGDPGWAPDRGQPGGGAAAAGDRAARPTRPSPPREARRRSRGGSRGRPPPRPRQAMIRVGRSCSSSTWKRMRLARPRPVGDITLAVPTEASRGSGYSLLAWPRRQQPDRRALPQAVAELAQWRGNCGPGPTRSAPDLGRPLRSTGSDHVAFLFVGSGADGRQTLWCPHGGGRHGPPRRCSCSGPN